MNPATKFVQPMDYAGSYPNDWAGYTFKAQLDYGTGGRHTGVDYNGPGAGNTDLGMLARSVSNGIVRATDPNNVHGFGKAVIIEHPLGATLKAQLGCDSLFSRYMHLASINVSPGQEVSIGQTIGTVGNTGTTWAHLHVDLYKSTIEGGGVHWRYDKHTELQSYLDTFVFIQNHLSSSDPVTPILQPNQRLLSNPTGVNQRELPSTSAKIIKEWPFDQDAFTFKGFVKGEDVNGNNIWFVGAISGGYFWSGAFKGGANTTGLSDLTAPVPTPTPTPVPPTYNFTKDLYVVTEVIPAGLGSFEYSNFSTYPEGIVLHDFGTDLVNTYESVINYFKLQNNISAHFVVSGKHITQMVALKDRAYHAGPKGNGFVGIELDPIQDPDTVASGKALVRALNEFYGKKLVLHKHPEFMATSCGDDFALSTYDPDVVPIPAPTPVPPTVDYDARIKRIEDKLIKMKEIL